MGPTYYNTFIEIAEDCSALKAEIPPVKGGKKTKAVIEYELIAKHPYKYTGEDIAFMAHAMHREIPKEHWAEERIKFFSQEQPCLRASALGKRYGWGIHHDANGRIALVAVESKEYKRFSSAADLKHTKAMRSRKV